MSTKFLLIGAILFVMQQTSFGLNCYSCTAGTDGCGASFKSTGGGVVQVGQTAATASCSKVVSASNANAIDRISSSTACTAGATAATAGADGYTTYCCTTDLCNGTSMKSASITLALTVAALSFFYMI